MVYKRWNDEIAEVYHPAPILGLCCILPGVLPPMDMALTDAPRFAATAPLSLETGGSGLRYSTLSTLTYSEKEVLVSICRADEISG
jgi:hypothetical protein